MVFSATFSRFTGPHGTLSVRPSMQRLFNLFLLFASVLGLMPLAVGAERWETLRAIHWVENPTNQTRPGSFGELGPYQFRQMTWRMHTQLPFSQAVNRAHADVVAVKHYEWIKRGLVRAGIDPSPFNIALAWNCGLGAVISGRVPTVTYRYAEQVTNLVESFQPRPKVATMESLGFGEASGVKFSLRPQVSPRFAIVMHGPRLVIGDEAPRFQLN